VPVRVNVNFSEQAYGTLRAIAFRNSVSMSEALRSALALKVWFDAERTRGHRILIESSSGQIREVLDVRT
jgi:hypothetical protein